MSKRAIRILPDRYGVAERETMRDYGTDCVTPYEIDGVDHREERPEELAVEHKYNGWANYQTWNVALYLDNDQGTYTAVVEYANSAEEPTYRGLIEHLGLGRELTPDDVHWLDSGLNHEELDEMVRDHREEGGA